MRYTKLPIGNVEASVLGFGCAAIMGRSGRKDSLRALNAAFDGGITFFDTARSYGYGESESVVGEFLRGRRDRVILSTKFGIVPTRQPRWKRALMPALRSVLDFAPSVRGLMRSQVKSQLKANQLTVKILRESLDESLRRLRTDHVDILFMHAAPESALSQIDVLEELDKLINAGKIRMAGISSEPEVIASALRTNHAPIRAMQFPINLFDLRMMRTLDARPSNDFLFVANHPFGGVERAKESKARLWKLASLPSTPAELQSKLNAQDDSVFSDAILNLILAGSGVQIVLPSMMKQSHLKANIESISNSQFSAEELTWIRRHFSEEMPAKEFSATPVASAHVSYR